MRELAPARPSPPAVQAAVGFRKLQTRKSISLNLDRPTGDPDRPCGRPPTARARTPARVRVLSRSSCWCDPLSGRGSAMWLACVSVLAAVHAVHARPALSVQLADGGVFDASDVLYVFGNLSRAQAMRLQGPSGGSYALQEKRGLLGSLDLLPTSDTGDVACQGSLNTERLVMVGDDQSLQLARKWLLTVPLDADGRVWDSSGQQYHQKRQGAWESAAEWTLMARLYAAHSGDRAIFREQAPERILCWEGTDGKLHNPGVALGGNDGLCSLTQREILDKLPAGQAITTEGYSDVYKTVDAGKDSPRKIVAAGRRLVQRITIQGGHARALMLPLLPHDQRGAPPNSTYPATLCVKAVAGGQVVFRTVLFGQGGEDFEVDSSGWIKISMSVDLQPGQYDVALTALHQTGACRHASQGCTPPVDSGSFSAKWLTIAAPTVAGQPAIGGARIETWGFEHAGSNGTSSDDNSCCAQSFAPEQNTLAVRLERGMLWQLALAKRADGKEGYGVLAVPDAFFDGVPAVGRGTSSASSMWDQVRMGWKSSYINLLFLASIRAWIELDEAGLVSTTKFNASEVFEQVRTLHFLLSNSFSHAVLRSLCGTQVKADIERQLMRSDGTMYSWISCNSTSPDGSDLICDRDLAPSPSARWPSTDSSGQSIIDTEMLPDQAWAVQLGVGGSKARTRLQEMVARGTVGGLVRNNLVPQESIDPRIVSSADEWNPVDARGFCTPDSEGNMLYAGHCVCSNTSSVIGSACWGNWGNNQQNGGRVFATMGTVFQAGPFPSAFASFRTNVENLRDVIEQLNDTDTSRPLLAAHRSYLRKSTADIPAGVPVGSVRNMCIIMHHGPDAVADKDAWGEDLCSHYKDITFGLRTGPKNMLLGFALGTLGLHVTAEGNLTLFGTTIPKPQERAQSTTWHGQINLPADVVTSWPDEVGGLTLGNLNVGLHRGVSVSCTVHIGLHSLQCQVSWGRRAGASEQ